MTQLNEFAINLPMTSVGMVGTAMAAPAAAIDCTPAALPADVAADKCDHISVWVEGAPQVNGAPDSSIVTMDLVLNVSITNPTTGTYSTYKIVKRLAMDKCKLAVDAEGMTPHQVVEGEGEPEDPALVEAEMKVFYHKREVMRKTGIEESAGTKTAKVLISYDDEEVEGQTHRASRTHVIKDVKDKAHARHVFKTKHAHAYKNPTITRVTMDGDK